MKSGKGFRTRKVANPRLLVLKDLLVDLIDSSKSLDARVWLDGVYTDISDEQVRGDWMNDRDVYFKVEGRVDKRNGS